jgi:hypothetical protein
MKYIKSFEMHRKQDSINEEFIGGLLKKLKNKLSLSFSKNFGKAKDVDNLIEKYKKEIFSLSDQKNKILSEYAKYIKENEELDPKKTEELNKKFLAAEKNFNDQVAILKKKFDIQFNEIVSQEKNTKINNYIQLRKLEMQQEMLSNELKYIFDVGLTEEELEKISSKDSNFAKIVTSIQGKMKKSEQQITTVTNELKNDKPSENKENAENSYFSIKEEDKEKAKSKQGFTDSPFVKGEVKLKAGDYVTYYSKEGKVYKATITKVDNTNFYFINRNGKEVGVLLAKVISKGQAPAQPAQSTAAPEQPAPEQPAPEQPATQPTSTTQQ